MHKRDAMVARAIRDLYVQRNDANDSAVIKNVARNIASTLAANFPQFNREEFLDLALGKGER